MKNKIAQLVLKSERGLLAARRHITDGDYDFSVSRSYYSMFHMAQALLLTKNLVTSKHSGLLSLFSEHFVEKGYIERPLHQAFHRAFELRQKGDYWSEVAISKETAEEAFENAEIFATALKKLLNL